MYSYISKLKNSKLILVLPEINLGGGSTKPLVSYINEKKFAGEEVVYIILNQQFSYIKLLMASIWGKRIIFNGLYSCSGIFPKLVIVCKKSVQIYLHESAHYFEHFSRLGAINRRFIKKIIRSRHILYCSEWQYRNTRSYVDPIKKTVVYNCISLSDTARHFLSSDHSVTRIGMAGYVQERKGVAKFEEIAGICGTKKLGWQFVWIGGQAGNAKAHTATNVLYIGNVDSTLHFLSKIDLLFFPSLEDPLPLVILETILLKKRILCYRENGFCDLLQNVQGVDFFDKQDSTDAIIEKAKQLLAAGIDEPAYDKLIEKLCCVSGFIQRIESIND